ncbi:hypothetical protein MHYP_G00072370 [Metynnis hypsauchen]
MGSSPAKPEFVTVLADKKAKEGEDVILRCEANIEEATAKWEKNGHTLECVEGKHSTTQSGTMFSLIIRNAAEHDEGNYNLNLLNEAGSASCSAQVIVVIHLFLTELNEWRDVQWNQHPLITALQNFKISNRKVKELRFLLVGPIGAGKSSIINTIKSIFAGHQFINCLATSDLMDITVNYQKHTIGTLPFAFCDTMGIERGKSYGVHTDDIVSALKGHMPNDYQMEECSIKLGVPMNCIFPLKNYHEETKLNEKLNCLMLEAFTQAVHSAHEYVTKCSH